MKLIIIVLTMILFSLQFKMWFGESSFVSLWQLGSKIDSQVLENSRIKQRNQVLEAEVNDLKTGMKAIEERARIELGMIKKGETFYQVIK